MYGSDSVSGDIILPKKKKKKENLVLGGCIVLKEEFKGFRKSYKSIEFNGVS